MTRVFLLTQGSVLAAGIRSVLTHFPGQSLKEAIIPSPEDLGILAFVEEPAITILDITGIDARELFGRLGQHATMLGKLVVASLYGIDEELLFSLMMWDVRAHISGATKPGEVLQLLRRVEQGEYLLSQDCLYHVETHHSMARIEREPVTMVVSPALTPLSQRETEVLCGIAQGKTNAEIAAALGINGDTIKNHMTTIFRKLRVTNRTAAVMVALRHNWISLAAVTCTGFDKAVA